MQHIAVIVMNSCPSAMENTTSTSVSISNIFLQSTLVNLNPSVHSLSGSDSQEFGLRNGDQVSVLSIKYVIC
jgi:hypothetical protein